MSGYKLRYEICRCNHNFLVIPSPFANAVREARKEILLSPFDPNKKYYFLLTRYSLSYLNVEILSFTIDSAINWSIDKHTIFKEKLLKNIEFDVDFNSEMEIHIRNNIIFLKPNTNFSIPIRINSIDAKKDIYELLLKFSESLLFMHEHLGSVDLDGL